ncbi:vacuolar protein sorting-associated protein 18 homolog [Stylophora pistillata]|uniref:vacuolar protein sorting-associated protein 18 homolog n=1 Tax=Stylophora pistillata TaxID=50429 RepID=UPI000C0571B4|nr:vacuolar protein sorting-associated protein 18 homolog [Stylophora pistillata]
MASILDQYMQASAGENLNPFLGPDITEPISTGYVEVRSEDDVPIFKRQKVNFRPPNNIVDVVVCNNIVAMVLSNNVLMRLDLTNPSEIDSVDITKRVDDSVHRIFMDPTARHLIVCMKSQESFYLARNSKKPKPLAKMKGHLINAIAWNKSKLTESSTQTILLGTTKGLVFETEVEPEEKFFQGGLEKFWKQLYNVNSLGGPEESIYGIMFEKFPVSPKSDRKYFVMVSTLSRLYQFIGDVTVTDSLDLQPLFAEYENDPAPFLEMPGHLDSSELALFYPKVRGLPSSFAWLTGSGLYFGKLDFSPPESCDNITAETRLLPFELVEGKGTTPLSIGLTGFHALMLYKDRFEAVSLLSEQVVFEDLFPARFGAMRGLCVDTVKKTLWIFADSAIFQYHVTRESRDVWKMYLERGEFELAKEYCRDNPANLDKVLTKQADELFESKNYAIAAKCYAQTQVSFEEVALKFIQVEESQALRMFLLKKLESIKHQDKTQMTMLIMWLIELYLNDLGSLRGKEPKPKYESVQEEFRKFLAQTKVKTCLDQNRKTAYDLITSHGDVENLIFFAVLMQDFEHVISHHIQQDDFMAALNVLTKQPADTDLYYKFSPVLMQHIPQQTVNAWIEQRKKKLDPRRLIPALVHYHQEGKPTQDSEEVCYDMKYALRLCSEHDKQEACVHIYSTMGLFEEAVDLSLKVDVDLAKIQAQKPSEDDEVLRKKLWLRIARHVVEEEGDVKKAMEFLNQSELLKIEDILPFFQDFVTIDHFKDAICSSLHEYNQHIEELKSEMQEATESARTIRGDIHEMRNKYSIVPAQEKCSICLYPLLTRGFYVFPCHHAFHSDCLKNEILPYLKEKQRAKVQELFNQLYATSRTDSSSVSSTSRESLKNELDDLMASECIYCGEIMIRSVDEPFISPDEYESVLESWQ